MNPSEPGIGWRRLLHSDSTDLALAELSARDQAALLVEAWREARVELACAESRLAARSRELDLLQALGRAAAEASAPDELFATTVSVLQQGEALDVALTASLFEGSPEITLFLARPAEEACVEGLVERAARFLGFGPCAGPRRVELAAYDAARGPRGALREEDLVLLPVLRRQVPVACLLAVPSQPAGEARLRLLYSAVNQLSLHLDRILTVREAEADRFRSIVDSMPQGVVLVDDGLRVLQCNQAARRMFEAHGLPFGDALAVALERLALSHLVQQVRTASVPLAEGEAHPGGDVVWNVTLSPLAGDRRAAAGLVLVIADVTDGRRLQRQLSQSEKMSSLGQMISGVTHELNNPLASILGYTQLIHASNQDEPLRRRLEILRHEAERCRKIVHNLLSFARQHEPERKPVSLNQVVESVLALMGYQLRVHDVRVVADLDPSAPAIEGDAHQLGQVLINLLTNAQHAIRQAGRPGVVSIRTGVDGSDAVVLEVRDDGPGISEAIRSRIFDPFFTTKPPGKGTGLGLALAYGIVTAHGGTIRIMPSASAGATFRLDFPRLVSRRDEPPTPEAESPCAVPASRILVVDDDEPVARLICEALAGDGHQTERVRDGRQALDRLADGGIDLIISDIRMPGMDGARLHEALRGGDSDPCVRLLLTTGDTLGTEPDELVARTGVDILHKPFDLEELRRRVRARLTR